MILRISLFFVLVFLPISAFANISLSSYRIFLDQDNRLSSFTVFNKSNNKQQCDIRFRHYDYNNAGGILEFKEKGIPDYSALPWFRMSPKRFVIEKLGVQKVTFSLRRKIVQNAAEYRSIVSLKCKDIDIKASDSLLTLNAQLVFNLPLTVRVGELPADIEIIPQSISDEQVKVKLLQKGGRSVFGDFIVYDGEEEIGRLKNISIYSSMEYKQIAIPVNKFDGKRLRFVFKERDPIPNALTVERTIEL